MLSLAQLYQRDRGAYAGPSVLAHRFEAPEGSILFLHNLGAEPARGHLGRQTERGEAPFEVFADGPYDPPGLQLQGLELRPWGYRWTRLRRACSV